MKIMKKILLFGCTLILLVTTSCNKWLEVKPYNQKTTDELFSTYNGFCDALNGCYIKLKDRSIYGEKLSMSNIESLAQLWRAPSETFLPADYELSNFSYTGDNAKTAISTIYKGLYNVIAQANMIINNMDEYGSVIKDTTKRSMIEGEAYAIRAFCHFDILRLFGQLPQNATILVSLPYAETVSATNLPSYYNYDQFIAKIESDLNKAESLLKNNDPIFKYTFDELNTVSMSDDFLMYRQNRFNYWAVKALQARFYLYTGNTTKAYTIAKSIIDAKGADGNTLITLSGATDIPAGYLACPSECLMMLNAYSLMDYSPSVLGAGALQIKTTHHVVSDSQLTTLFADQNTASSNRYNDVWDHSIMDYSGTIYPALKKYYYNTSTSVISSYINLTKRQVIPLIRLSEVYLIAIETTTDLAEANSLWFTYQLSHSVLLEQNAFTSLDAVRTEMINEYRREFYGEGQMFYTYKRMGANSMLWRNDEVTETNYTIPLPSTEYNPN
jgi:starch-binding outer membrane protein, SusD/RagB family